jgi:hypothetical protein
MKPRRTKLNQFSLIFRLIVAFAYRTSASDANNTTLHYYKDQLVKAVWENNSNFTVNHAARKYKCRVIHS